MTVRCSAGQRTAGRAGPEGRLLPHPPARRRRKAINFAKRRGQTFGLVGESGSGKSSVSVAIIGFLAPGTTVSGSITFCDSDVLGTPERRMRALRGKDIGLIYRDPVAALNPVRTTGVQSREPLRLHVGMSRRQAEECAVELLLRVGIDEPREKLRSYPHESAAACASGW